MAMRDDGLATSRTGRESAFPREQLAGPGQQRRQTAPGGAPARQATRIGDAERDTAAAELGDHYAAGRLSLEELHERIGLVLSARTCGQLGRAMRDLPSARREPRATPRPRPVPGEPPLSGRQQPAGAAHDGRAAAIGLLLVALLIWLFTVVMFTRHGYYYSHYPYHPSGPWGHR